MYTICMLQIDLLFYGIIIVIWNKKAIEYELI